MQNKKSILIVVENGDFPHKTEEFLYNNGYVCENKLNRNYKSNNTIILRSYGEIKKNDIQNMILKGLQDAYFIAEMSEECHSYNCAKIMLENLFIVPSENDNLLNFLDKIGPLSELNIKKPVITYKNNDIIFNVSDRIISRDNFVICQLTKTQTKVLDLLLSNVNVLTSRFAIETHLNYPQNDLPGRGVDMLISSLRKRLSVVDPTTRIEAVRCAGYRILGEWTREAEYDVAN